MTQPDQLDLAAGPGPYLGPPTPETSAGKWMLALVVLVVLLLILEGDDNE